MIKLSRDQQFWWLEPFAFAAARSGVSPQHNRANVFFGLFLALLAALLLAAFPSTPVELAAAAGIAAAGAFVLSALLPLFRALPNDVLITSDSFFLGRLRIPFDTIAHAVVCTTRLNGRDFRVLTFRTKTGQSYTYGLSKRVDPSELEIFLASVGLRKPCA